MKPRISRSASAIPATSSPSGTSETTANTVCREIPELPPSPWREIIESIGRMTTAEFVEMQKRIGVLDAKG